MPDVFVRMVRGCFELGCTFAEDDGVYVLVPGNYAAQAVVRGLQCLFAEPRSASDI